MRVGRRRSCSPLGDGGGDGDGAGRRRCRIAVAASPTSAPGGGDGGGGGGGGCDSHAGRPAACVSASCTRASFVQSRFPPGE